jgi:hypothetical protein
MLVELDSNLFEPIGTCIVDLVVFKGVSSLINDGERTIAAGPEILDCTLLALPALHKEGGPNCHE